jgi:hypothetical protein
LVPTALQVKVVKRNLLDALSPVTETQSFEPGRSSNSIFRNFKEIERDLESG